MKFKNNYSLSPQKNTKLVVKHLFALIFIGALSLSCSKDDAQIDSQIFDNNTLVFNGIETEVISLVNIHRESLGLSKLNLLTPAYFEASGHNKYMIEQGKTSHDNFELRSKNLMNAVSAKLILENVAAGYPTAEQVMKAWLGSELHRKNIENPMVQYLGISVQKSTSGVNYFTQIFVGK